MQAALTKGYGSTPYIGCSGPRYNTTAAGRAANSTDTGYTYVSEVWYYFHGYGRPQNGQWVPINATIPQSSCSNATGALYYYERSANSTVPL